jgi:hypothetical protein
MNKLGKITFKLALITEILALTLLAACTTVGNALGTTASSTICRATGDPANPYEEITVTNAELAYPNAELAYPNDISPMPVNGCPTSLVVINDGKINFCHATGKTTTPYEQLSVSAVDLDGHGTHKGDVFPTAEGGCPTTIPTAEANNNDKITICHATGSKKNPYTEITVSVNGLNGHDKHDGDIIPAPLGGCPATK